MSAKSKKEIRVENTARDAHYQLRFRLLHLIPLRSRQHDNIERVQKESLSFNRYCPNNNAHFCPLLLSFQSQIFMFARIKSYPIYRLYVSSCFDEHLRNCGATGGRGLHEHCGAILFICIKRVK